MNSIPRVIVVLLSSCLLVSTLLGQADSRSVPLINDSIEDGWVEVGAQGVWEVHDGVLQAVNPANYPNWLRSEKPYENFILDLEYRVPGWCEGGVLLHAPLHGRLSRSGLKIHLRHNNQDEGVRSAGAIYDVLEPAVLNVLPRTEWNRLKTEMSWPWLKVVLNDQVIHSVNMEEVPDLRNRLRSGFLGFQDLGCKISYRNVRIQELPGREEWRSLFNGKDLSGWQILGEADWKVEGGAISAHDGDSYLISDEDYSDFEFQIYVRASHLANGGVFFRWQSRQNRGYEAQIYNVADATNPTGSIYLEVPAVGSDSRDGEWFLMQIVSSGTYGAVRIDGKTVAESFQLAKTDRGKIALQMHGKGRIEFLNPQVKLLRK